MSAWNIHEPLSARARAAWPPVPLRGLLDDRPERPHTWHRRHRSENLRASLWTVALLADAVLRDLKPSRCLVQQV